MGNKPAKKNQKKWLKIAVEVILISAWTFASVVASQFVIGYIMLWTVGADTFSKPLPLAIYYVLANALAISLVVFVPAALLVKRKAKKPRRITEVVSRTELGLKGWPTWTDIGLSPVGCIVSLMLAAGLVALFSQFSWFDPEQAQETGFSLYASGFDRVISFIALVVVAPIAEEIIFRGWMYGKLREKLSGNLPEWGGIVLSTLIVSVIFGLAHFQWNVGLNVFCLSIVLCGLREITGTIYAGILTHMLRNGLALCLMYFMGVH
jgi:hypothetical protein